LVFAAITSKGSAEQNGEHEVCLRVENQRGRSSPERERHESSYDERILSAEQTKVSGTGLSI